MYKIIVTPILHFKGWELTFIFGIGNVYSIQR